MKYRLLDLFCGAGGCSVGYARAGFDVVGVDIEPHDDYPFELHVMDWEASRPMWDDFDVIHASPPCQSYTAMRSFGTMGAYPDPLGPVLGALREWGGVWVVENVPGAPFDCPTTQYCGGGLGLKLPGRTGFYLRRHRLFASSAPLMAPPCDHAGSSVPVTGHGTPSSFRARHGFDVLASERRRLMGVEWMRNRDDVSEAIPPAYTEHIGHQLIDYLEAVAA